MKQKSIMKKSAFMTRRKIIIYIVLTILILGIVAGFTDPFITDNTKYTAGMDEIIVMEAEPPMSGSPEDYDLISNLKFAAYKLHHASFFRGETNGKVVADLGITTYTQNIHNTRYATGEGIVFAETISASSMKSVAEQKYADNGIIIYRPSTSVNGTSATFSNSAYAMSYEDYSKNYGSVPNQLSKYIINEKTIMSVKDENAKTKAAAKTPNGAPQARDGDGFDFVVPDSIVAGEDGTYTFSLTLDATESTLYYRNEVRTLGGADQNPKFYAVSVTVTIDKNWNPISVRSVETYDIAIPVLGAMSCTGTLTEVFTQIGDPEATVPERDFFQPYVDEAKKNPDFNGGGKPPAEDNSPATYLAAAFGDYLSGAKNLDLTVDMAIDDFTAYDLTLSLNLSDMAVRATIGDLYVGYSGDKVNIKLNGINGYVTAAEFSELLKDERVGALLGGLGEFDFTALFGGDILGTVFADCEMTTEDGVRRIHMPFAIDASALGVEGVQSVYVDASIYIKEDGKILQSITGDITLLGKTVTVVAKPLKTPPVFPATDNAVSLSGMLDFVPDMLATAAQPVIGISGEIAVMGQTVRADAYIDRENGKAEAIISLMGADMYFKYADGSVYVGMGNIDARGTVEELPALTDALLGAVDLGKYADLIRRLMPESLNEVLAMVKSLDVADDRLTLGLNFLTSPVELYTTRADGMISGFGLNVNFDMLGVKFDATADFAVSVPAPREIVLPSSDGYITFTQLAQLITDVAPYLETSANYDVALSGDVKSGTAVYSIDGEFAIDKTVDGGSVVGTTAAGKLCAVGQTVNVVYADGTAYIELAGIKVKLASADMGKFKSPAMRMINAIASVAAIDPAQILGDAVGAVKSVTVNADGALVAIINVDGNDITVVFAPKSGRLTVVGSVGGVAFDLSVDVKITDAVRDVCAPADADTYMNAAELDATLDKLADIAESKAVYAPVEIIAGGNTFAAELALSFADGLKARLTEATIGLDVTLHNGTVYFALGEIRIAASAADLSPLIAALDGIVPADILQSVKAMLDGTADIQTAIAQALEAIGTPALDNGVITVTPAIGATTVTAEIAADLSTIKITTDGATVTMRPQAKAVDIPLPDGEFTPAAELIAVIPELSAYVASGAATLGFNASVISDGENYDINGNAVIDLRNGFNVSAAVRALGQTLNVSYVNGVVYIEIGAIKAKLDTSDMSGIKAAALEMLSALGINAQIDLPVDLTDIKSTIAYLVGAVTAFDVKDGTLHIDVTAGGATVRTSMTPATGAIDIDCTSASVTATATASITASTSTVVAPTDAQAYVNVARLDTTMKSVAEIARKGGLKATLEIDNGGEKLYAALELGFADGLQMRITEPTLALDLTVKNGSAYFALGDIKLTGTASDLPAALTAFKDAIPEQLNSLIETITSLTNGIVSANSLRSIAETAINAIAELSVTDGVMFVRINADGVNATVRAPLGLESATAEITLGGSVVTARLNAITASAVQIAAPVGSYVQAKDLIAAAAPFAHVAVGEAVEIDINAEVYGVPVTGTAYMCFGGANVAGIGAEINVFVGDLPVIITVQNSTVFIKIGSHVCLSEQLNEQSIMALVDKLDYAIAGLKETVQKIIDGIKSMTVRKLISSLALAPVENGFEFTADLTPSGLDLCAKVRMITAGGALSSVQIDCNMLGIAATMDFDAVLTDGKLDALVATSATVGSVPMALSLAPTAAEVKTITEIPDCAPLSAAANYIAPIFNLISEARTAQSVTLDINASMVTADNNYASIKGSARISFAPLALDVSLRLFADTADEETLNILFAEGVLYLQSGNIKLSFNTVADIDRLYSVIQGYVQKGWIPEYLGKEVGKLFGKEQGASIFSDITLLVERFGQIANSDGTPQTVAGLLFAPLQGLNNDSAIKSVINMLRIFKRGADVVISVDAMGATLNVTPRIAERTAADGSTEYIIDSLSVDTNMFNTYFNASVCNYDLRDSAIEIAPPADVAEYVSIIEFIETVNNAVNTLTARDLNDNITFALNTFAFDYDIYKIETTMDENGNTVNVKDEAGRDKPLKDQNGNKIIDKTVKVGNKADGSPVLKGKFEKRVVKDDNGNPVIDEKGEQVSEYKFSLEAHVKIEITTPDKSSAIEYTNMTPLLVDLYVINNDSYPNGMAFLDYMENNGNGERISIDYTSVMEIVAAAMDIMGVNPETVELLLGDYRQSLDKTLFESLDLGGIADLRAALNGVADAVNDGKAALRDLQTAWSLVMTAGSTEELRNRLDDIKPLVNNAMQKLKSAIAAFGDDDAPAEQPDQSGAELNGKLYKDIVNGVTLRKDGATVWATVSNEIATGTSGTSYVAVTQTAGTIDSIQVRDLDVNTAKLKDFTAHFTAGEDITVTLPSDYDTTKDNATYSNFANIKYLLFDIMNTANLMEFDMGDIDNATAENKINITINLGIIEAVNLNVKYNIKVKIIDRGEGAIPRFDTVVALELVYSGCKALGAQAIYDGTTRLYFYDNTIYIQGVEWFEEEYKNWLGQTKYRWARRDVTVKYTLDELSAVMSSGNAGTEKFMYEFLFYLLPLSRDFTFIGVDMQKEITKAALEMVTDDGNRTVAKVFKGYSYTDGKHDLTIGLKELVGVSAFNDLNLSITGANDGDDNILDNYVSNMHVDTSFIGMVTLSLDAKLNNAQVYPDADGVNKLRSSGLTSTTTGHDINGIINTVIPSTQWNSIWAA